jgi:hypothetical protein
MYSKCRNIIIGFHGCDKSVRDEIIAGKSFMKKSNNDYDWLGNGFYFWENNIQRAKHFAEEKQKRNPNKITEPAVLGAFIDLGYCLDLLDSSYLSLLKEFYSLLKETYENQGTDIPINQPVGNSFDLLLRNLDCAVIESVHIFNKDEDKQEFDSVRGVFWEGNDLYPNAGFKEKNHIQICVRNPNCIKGFFIPREYDSKFIVP